MIKFNPERVKELIREECKLTGSQYIANSDKKITEENLNLLIKELKENHSESIRESYMEGLEYTVGEMKKKYLREYTNSEQILNLNLKDAKLLCRSFKITPPVGLSEETLEKFNEKLNITFNTKEERDKMLRLIELEKEKNHIKANIIRIEKKILKL